MANKGSLGGVLLYSVVWQVLHMLIYVFLFSSGGGGEKKPRHNYRVENKMGQWGATLVKARCSGPKLVPFVFSSSSLFSSFSGYV